MKYAIILLLMISFCSCEEGLFHIGENKAADYMPLQIGNYWIYETSSELPDGTILSSYDTIRIDKDTILGGKTYSILEGSKFGKNYKALLRTERQLLITAQDQILLDCQDKGSPLLDSAFIQNGDTIYTVQYNTTKWPEDNTLNLPVGSYKDIFLQTRIFSLFQPHEGINETPLTATAYYAKNVGLVRDQFFYLNSGLSVLIELREYGQKDLY